MRVAVIDIGTNSTRLLVAEIEGGSLRELERRSVVTRLGEGVEQARELADEAQRRVFSVLDDYADLIHGHDCDVRTAVMTSAVRDARNGEVFRASVERRYALRTLTIAGDEEARLTFLGATATRPAGEEGRLAVVDIGGGSTEIVTGTRERLAFHVSTQVGVVRHTERHISHDPPLPAELDALAGAARSEFQAVVPRSAARGVRTVIAVAGTATSAAAIDLGGHDRVRVEGHRLGVDALREQLERLAGLPLDERRRVPGLHPDRAPTIVAGLVILLQALAVFGAREFEASDRDILWGVALDLALKAEASLRREGTLP